MNSKLMYPSTYPVARAHLASTPVYTPGQAIVEGVSEIHKLSSNESALGMSPAAVDAIRRLAGELHIYPDADGAPLVRAIAQHHGLDPQRVVTAPGSEFLISWLMQGMLEPGDEVVYSAHAFQAYRIRAISNGNVPVAAPEPDMHASVDALLSCVTSRTRLVFLTNPNNPTGTYLPARELARLRDGLPPDVLLVVDEAYFEYVGADDYVSALSLVDTGVPNVAVIRTFSKFYGLAGLRVGWGYLPKHLAGPIGKLRGPFAVSRMALDAAIAALSDADHQKLVRAHNDKWRAWLHDQLRRIGFRTTESFANFVLFEVPGGSAGASYLHKKLAAKGYLTRIADQNALPSWIRVSIGSAASLEGFVGTLRQIAAAPALEGGLSSRSAPDGREPS